MKENGRLNIDVAGTVSNLINDSKEAYIVIDGETVSVKSSSSKLLTKIKQGEYVKLSCYLENGKVFATDIK